MTTHKESARRRRAKWEIDRAIHAALADNESNEEAHARLVRLVAHLRSEGDLLRLGSGRGWADVETYVGGLCEIAFHHDRWRREVETWQAPRAARRVQFRALLRHLFAEKYVPPHLDAAWLAGGSTYGWAWQNWFLHMGCVGTLRGVRLPRDIKLTRLQAFLFAAAPEDVSPLQALFTAAQAGELPRRRANRFPATTTRRRRKRAIARAGRPQLWPQAPFGGLDYMEEGRDLRWTIRQIRTRDDLLAEGRAMHHCVGDYARRCAKGLVSIWSLCQHSWRGTQRLLTLQVYPRTRALVQARGPYNRWADDVEVNVLKVWAERERLTMAL